MDLRPPATRVESLRILLDEVHEEASLGCSSTHQYVYGNMNGHNVVMGCLPVTQMGTASAVAVATEMTSTFPSLRFGLLVGVGGGVPGRQDIRLGDVVVSQPDPVARHGGVIQYDFGKALHGGEFQTTGMLNQPPEILLSALSKVQSTPRRRAALTSSLTMTTLKMSQNVRSGQTSIDCSMPHTPMPKKVYHAQAAMFHRW